VNNAGVGRARNYLDADPEVIERVIRVNYLGSVWTTLAFLPGLGKGSHLANVVSIAGTVAIGPYSASKHAQLAFSRSIAVEARAARISVHTVNPGFVETEGFRSGGRFGPLFSRLVIEPSSSPSGLLDAWRRTSARSWCRAGIARGLGAGLAPGVFTSARARTSR